MHTTGLTVVGSILPPGDPSTWTRRTCIASVPVSPGHAIFGDPATGRVDSAGRGQFLGIALAEGRPERSFLVLSAGIVYGFALDSLPAGTSLFQGEDPERLSTLPNRNRPRPLATVVHEPNHPHWAGQGRKVLQIHGQSVPAAVAAVGADS